jgi:hypothetical protein
MSIEPVAESLTAAPELSLDRDPGLAARLAPGQVIQGKVLHRYDGNRYLVRFLGHDRMVDSAVPLRPNEVIHGRVVALHERIELQRVEQPGSSPADAAAQAAEEPWLALSGGRAAQVIEQLFRRYRATLEPQEAERLRRLAARAASPERMALAGLVAVKTRLPLDPDLLQCLYWALDDSRSMLTPLAEPAAWPAAQRVLNVQPGGSVAHGIGGLPVEARGAVVEVQAALFEEQRDPQAAPGLQHRKLVILLDTERLGRLELRAVMADSHVRVAIAAERADSADVLQREGDALARSLADAGLEVDEVRYETGLPGGNAVAAAAAEHLVIPGSVSRWL